MISNLKFDLNLPTRVIFEPGSRSQIINNIASFGKRALLIHSKSHPMISGIIQEINDSKIELVPIAISGEPSTESITAILSQIDCDKFDCVLGIGGGSVIDSAKAISALLTNPGPITDYLEIVGKNLPISNSPIPYIAVPTTAGTGSEVTKNAVLNVEKNKIKVSLRSTRMIPRVAIIDPELTYSMPAEVTASTGMDAIIQLIEPFVSSKANSFTDGICREGLTAAAGSIRKVFSNLLDPDSRSGMSYASLCGGIALANSGLGAVHGFAGVIGGMYSKPHGQICAALLTGALEKNINAIAKRQGENHCSQKYRELAVILTGRADAKESDVILWSREICNDLKIPSLSALGISRSEFDEICEKAAVSSSMKGNPILLTSEELNEILEISF